MARVFASTWLNVTGAFREFASNQGIMLGVDGFTGHIYSTGASRWEMLVKWSGLQEIEASWEPLESLRAEVHMKVCGYASTTGDEEKPLQR
ncbi:LOW QUALITY PROTEIN: Hypothetical protein PHPALM_37568 [Phytophthora palmivora]|uniref:Chromo domain-containing protein n=1 Tax=Phytophthora palmivora TaxID=4796 RepID=A0A2P4WX46_9STRA|nr:LOW QUALITY PROTEIN: Hypothetical protein PHPALM_37568 [Phytophthora palmivora]